MGTGRPCKTCGSEWCAIWTAGGAPHGFRDAVCNRCGVLKKMHVNTMTCDECTEPLLKAVWGDDYDRVMSRPPMIPFDDPPPARSAKKRNQGREGRRRS